MRCSLKYALDALGTIREAVEVGARDGKNAESMLACSITKLYLVDDYQEYEEPGGSWTREKQDAMRAALQQRISSYNGRVKFLEKESTDAAASFKDGQLDYIYIDAKHDYESVLRDLTAWYPKLARWGVLAGHDYGKEQFPGVAEAVTDFAKAKDLKIVTAPDSDWWVKQKTIRVVSYFHGGKVKPYERMMARMVMSAEKFHYPVRVYAVGHETVGDSIVGRNLYYVSGAGKPEIIRRALDEYRDDVLFLDLDCEIQKEVDWRDVLSGADAAVTIRRIEDRQKSRFAEQYLNSGVLFFRNNAAARSFINIWDAAISEGECDQTGLTKVMLRYSEMREPGMVVNVEGTRVKLLPAEKYNFFYFPEDASGAVIVHNKGFSYRGDYKR
jgi:hypothetical protein